MVNGRSQRRCLTQDSREGIRFGAYHRHVEPTAPHRMGRAAPTRTSTLTAAPMALRDQPPRTSRPATSQAIGSRRIARKAHGTRTDTAIQGQAGRRTPQYKAEREGEGTQSSGGWEVTHRARAQGRSREGRRVSTRSPPLVTSPQVKSARLTFSRSPLARPLLCELALEGPSSAYSCGPSFR